MLVKERLRPHVFRLPIEKIRAGYKSDVYFNRTKLILEADNRHTRAMVRLFQRADHAVVVGTDQTLAVLHVGAGYYRSPRRAQQLFERYVALEREAYGLWLRIGSLDWDRYSVVGRDLFETSRELDELWVSAFLDLDVQSLHDGEITGSGDTVMVIEGDYSIFAHLETIYLGALSDGTMVATNTRSVVEAAQGKPVMMFGARHQGHELQSSSGYAAFIGGAKGVSTDEQAEWWGSKGIGTIPHALIAVYGGDTVLATVKFAEYIDPSVSITSLVDFDNDCVGTSVAVARVLGDRLWGVRLDTAENMVDRSIFEDVMTRGQESSRQITGVTPELVWNVRRALDAAGFEHVKIIASSGFDAERIRYFEQQSVPVDVYGVGSALFDGQHGKFDYTADVVRVDGRDLAKKGRSHRANDRLHRVDLEALAREKESTKV